MYDKIHYKLKKKKKKKKKKINTQKSPAFLYINNEKSQREIKESIPFIIAAKRIKYLGINLPKETKELYTENYTNERNQRQHKQMER